MAIVDKLRLHLNNLVLVLVLAVYLVGYCHYYTWVDEYYAPGSCCHRMLHSDWHSFIVTIYYPVYDIHHFYWIHQLISLYQRILAHLY